jgi:hypothetical protein
VTFCRRQRVITPCRFGLALTAPCASQRVETLADCHGGFQALCGTTVPSKAFDNPVAKPHCAAVARTMTERRIRAMTLQGLGVAQGHACAAFRPSVLQDGRALALHDGLREVWPGRCNVVTPAAVELHPPMDLLCEAPTPVVLPPDTTHAQAVWPEPTSLRARGLVADRGYGDFHSRRRVQDEGGFFLIRAKAGRNPQGLEACRADGQRRRALRHTALQTLHATRPKRPRGARMGQWEVEGHPLGLRLLLSWHHRTKRFGSLLTHRAPRRSPLAMLCRASPWRWPVEWLWQAGTASATLPACDPEHPALVEGCMGAAMAAAARKRCLAHRPPLLAEAPLSTRKVARGAMHVFGDLVEALQNGDGARLSVALEAASTSLARQAQRAHPARDRHTGRSQLGLEPCCETDDRSELAEAA